LNPSLRRFVPEVLREFGNRALGAAIVHRGPYADWNTAAAQGTGYDDDAVLRRVRAATELALANPDLYEQDGTVQRGPAPPSDALAALLLAAARDGRLSVLDFGGGLASHVLRWRKTLAALRDWQWCVVEQPHYVAAGRQLFAGIPRVTFRDSITAARDHAPNAVLASSVLQYVPDPLATMHEIVASAPGMIVLDRTPFADSGEARIIVQHVPANLGKASYPMWVLSRDAIEAPLHAAYDLVHRFDSDDRPVRLRGANAHFGGSAWIRRT
jgi:putative methyltransferase (TIGR04325 family)